MHLLEKDNEEDLYIVAFRGSGKSTMVTTAYPIWAILGKQEKKFVVIFCQTQAQAKQHMMNLRRELENNELLKKDLGPFQEDSDEWGSQSLVFSNTKARITVASSEQSIRGLRHHEHRPDLFICDSVEYITSTKTREGRDKTYRWLRGDVIPAGDKNTKLIVIGNLLHEDSLLMRLHDDVKEDRAEGKFLFFPLIDEKNMCLWPGKYPSHEDIKKEQKKVGNEISWQREYLLNIVPDYDQVIHREWISFYDIIPSKELKNIVVGVDLAISQKDTADYTALVSAKILGESPNTEIYIIPPIVNERLTFPQQVEKCKDLNKVLKTQMQPEFVIESVGYQDALAQQLKLEGLNVRLHKVGRSDKRSRLMLTSNWIKEGKIFFPQQGAEELINQIINFGIERNDDLVDAFSALVLDTIQNPPFFPHFLVA